jgi:CheY-like chemotaxis protein
MAAASTARCPENRRSGLLSGWPYRRCPVVRTAIVRCGGMAMPLGARESAGDMNATVTALSDFSHGRTRAPRLTLVRGGGERAHAPAASREIRVLIAARQTLMRAALRVSLEAESGIVVAGEAGTGEEAVSLARRTRSDVVLLDTSLPGLDAVAATRQIASLPRARVMLLGASDCEDSVFGALRAGASGFLVMDLEPAELVRAVRVLARGDAMLSPAVTRRLIARLAVNE